MDEQVEKLPRIFTNEENTGTCQKKVHCTFRFNLPYVRMYVRLFLKLKKILYSRKIALPYRTVPYRKKSSYEKEYGTGTGRKPATHRIKN